MGYGSCGRKLVIEDLEKYHRLIGCGVGSFTMDAWRITHRVKYLRMYH